MSVCVCVRERERERESACTHVHIQARIYMYKYSIRELYIHTCMYLQVCVYVCKCFRVFCSFMYTTDGIGTCAHSIIFPYTRPCARIIFSPYTRQMASARVHTAQGSSPHGSAASVGCSGTWGNDVLKGFVANSRYE